MKNITQQGCITLVLLCSISFQVSGFENFKTGSRFMALSGCSTTLPDIWSVSQNQAGMAFLDHGAVSLSSERRFALSELSVHSLTTAIPSKYGSFGALVNYYGFSKYHETKSGIAYAIRLSQKTAVGVMLNYFNAYSPGISTNNNKISAEIGLMSRPLPNFTLGFHLCNPVVSKPMKGKDAVLPSTLNLGISYSLKEMVRIMAEVRTGSNQKPNYSFGLEYMPVKNLSLRTGANTWPAKISGGIGYKWNHFEFGLAFAQHPTLGTSSSLDLSYFFY